MALMSTELGLSGGDTKLVAGKAMLSGLKSKGKKVEIHSLCSANKVDVLGQLLAAGEDPNVRNQHGQTALYLAAKGKKHECAKLLLEHRVSALRLGAPRGWRLAAGDWRLAY